MAKKLVNGQKVYLETVVSMYRPVEERKVREFQVVRSNGSSAYIVLTEETKRGGKPVEWRVDQRTRKVKDKVSLGNTYKLWETEEDFLTDVEYKKEYSQLYKQAKEKLDEMTLEEIREFIKGD